MQKMFGVRFFKSYSNIAQVRKEYILLFLVNGGAQIITSGKTYELEKEDYIIINSAKQYQVLLERNSLLLEISMEREGLCSLSHNDRILFYCVSSEHQGSKYEKFRFVIGELLSNYAVKPQGLDPEKMSSLYKVCSYMINYFAVSADKVEKYGRNSKNELVLKYIEEHYREKISLEDVAREVFMAPASFSRYFSREMGISFVNYVNNVRIEYAVQELLASETSISDIAWDNGFGSVSQFNKIFRKKYKMSPREYKEKWKEGSISEENETSLKVEDLEEYRSKTRLTVVKEQRFQIKDIRVDMTKGEKLVNPWKEGINLGFASLLLNAEYQRQMKILKQKLEFKYGIINGLFAAELKLFDDSEDDVARINFVLLDQVLDFLVEHKIHPFLVIDDQINSMLKEMNTKDKLDCRQVFKNLEQCQSVLAEFLEHIVYRYGMREVSQWYFSVWYNEFSDTTLGLSNRFAEVWDMVCSEIKRVIPDAKVGGAGIGPSVEKEELWEFYQNWGKAQFKPDYIYFHAFPYRESKSRLKMEAIRRKIDDFFIRDISDIRKTLHETGFADTPLIVQEWNLSFVQRNAFNDMAAKAAIIVKRMSQSIGEIKLAAYWPASDLYAGDYDASRLLNGACGLISANGICKPVLYAIGFIGELQDIVVSRGNHYIVTKDDRGNYSLLLFNEKELNYVYYSKAEAAVKPEDENQIFENQDSLEIKITLENMPDKKYIIHKRIIGPSCGSVLDEWRELGADTTLTISDLEYLRNRCVPYRKNEEIFVENHEMVLMESLRAHEIMLLKIR